MIKKFHEYVFILYIEVNKIIIKLVCLCEIYLFIYLLLLLCDFILDCSIIILKIQNLLYKCIDKNVIMMCVGLFCCLN